MVLVFCFIRAIFRIYLLQNIHILMLVWAAHFGLLCFRKRGRSANLANGTEMLLLSFKLMFHEFSQKPMRAGVPAINGVLDAPNLLLLLAAGVHIVAVVPMLAYLRLLVSLLLLASLLLEGVRCC